MPIYTYPVIYLIIIFAAIFNYKKYRRSFVMRLFLYFLIYSCITEIVGGIYGNYFNKSTFFIYNTWNITNHFFYFYFFKSLIDNPLKRKYINLITVVYGIFTLINVFFLKDYFNQGLIHNIIAGSTMVVVSIMIYHTELLKSDEILNIQKSIYFWISIGVLIFNIGLIPVFIIAELIFYQGVFDYIIFALNIFMGICFIIGFIKGETLTKKD